MKIYTIIETVHYEKYRSTTTFLDNEMGYLEFKAAAKSLCDLVFARLSQETDEVDEFRMSLTDPDGANAKYTTKTTVHEFMIATIDTIEGLEG